MLRRVAARNDDQWRDALRDGRGSVVVRGRASVEEIRKDREAIVVTELPYQVNKQTLIERIAEMVREKRLEGVSDVRDESDRQGMRIVIELKRDASGDVILNQLWRYTAMQSSFGVNMLALNHGRPEQMGLRALLEAFLDFREEVVVRRVKFELNKARDRGHVLVGLAVAVANIDEVIHIIRSSADPTEAREAVFSAIMIICNGLVGLCLLLGGYRHGEQELQPMGASAYLAVLIALSVLTLIIPDYTTSAAGPRLTSLQLVFISFLSLILYGAFLFIQTVRHRSYFLDARSAAKGHFDTRPAAKQALAAGLGLVASLIGVVILADHVVPTMEEGVRRAFETIASGAARAKLDEFVAFTAKVAAHG